MKINSARSLFPFLLISFLLLNNQQLLSQTIRTNLAHKLDSLILSANLYGAQTAVDVFDLTNDEKIVSFNERLLLRPASVLKILTSAAALKFLDDDFNFVTSVLLNGEIEDSVCIGDLIIKGGFDPDFSTEDLQAIVAQIKNLGVKKIAGNIYADVSAGDSLFWGEGWMWDDDPYPFLPYLSPLNINNNTIQVICGPTEIGQNVFVKTQPENNFIEIENNCITVDTGRTNFYLTRDWLNRNNNIKVSGTFNFSDRPDTVRINIFNPAFYFLNLLKESFEKSGINIAGNTDTSAASNSTEEIFAVRRNIDSVLVKMNKESDNLNAEMILRALSINYFQGKASAKKGIVLIDSLISLIGFDPKNYRIADGSGLSFYNLVSAELITEILKYFYFNDETNFIKLYNSFPISAFDGTLADRMKDSPVERRVRAKTGTLSGVSSLAGFLRTENGNLIAFTIFIQSYTGGATKIRRLQDEICELLYGEL